jgi:hypothetical protein
MCREYEGTVVLLSGIICVTVTIIFGKSCKKLNLDIIFINSQALVNTVTKKNIFLIYK